MCLVLSSANNHFKSSYLGPVYQLKLPKPWCDFIYHKPFTWVCYWIQVFSTTLNQSPGPAAQLPSKWPCIHGLLPGSTRSPECRYRVPPARSLQGLRAGGTRTCTQHYPVGRTRTRSLAAAPRSIGGKYMVHGFALCTRCCSTPSDHSWPHRVPG